MRSRTSSAALGSVIAPTTHGSCWSLAAEVYNIAAAEPEVPHDPNPQIHTLITMRSISLALLSLAAAAYAAPTNDGGDQGGNDQGGGDHGGGDHGGGDQGGGDQGGGDQGGGGQGGGGQGGGQQGGGEGGGGAAPREPTPVPATWDGFCYYAKPDIAFDLSTYFGRWFQVAGTEFKYVSPPSSLLRARSPGD